MASLPPWIEVRDERFIPLVLPNARLETLAGDFAWLEGPVWFADANQLLVSDLPNDRIMRWTPSGSVDVFRQPSGFSNGHTRDREGRLLCCSHAMRAVNRTELDGRIVSIAEEFEGEALNGPNDIVVGRDGAIWFTDPLYGGGTDYEGGKHDTSLPPSIYKLTRDGRLSVADRSLHGPNGLCFSPDERLLYVVDSGEQFGDDLDRGIFVFDVQDGALCNKRLFHRVRPGHSDGIRCDEDGRVWSAAGNGVHCIHPDGTLLGAILTGCAVSNLCFGGRNYSRLFICASHELKSVYVNVRGAQRP